MKTTMKIAFYTLGCKVNQYETQAMESELLKRGHEIVDFGACADAYVINSCTVTAVSDKKARQAIHRARRSNADALVAVCGCYAQTNPDAVADADLISGTGDRLEFIDRLETLVKGQRQLDDPMRRKSIERLSAGSPKEHTRAYLKVEDGCSNFCTYCVIPFARGPVRSLPISEALDEVRRLKDSGYPELVLTGIELSSYGEDFHDGTTLIGLIEAICAQAPEMRIRLGSLEPRTIDREFCERLKKLPNLCPHFHPSLQSGCDATLKRMARRYTSDEYLASIELLREYFPRCAVTTDLIVGFPSEDESEFVQTLEFIEKCSFARMHIFPYSRRPGTAAAKMTGQIKNTDKEERAKRAGAAAQIMRQEYLNSCVGEIFDVLFETEENGLCSGHAPNYTEVLVNAAGLRKTVRKVLIKEVRDNELLGDLL